MAQKLTSSRLVAATSLGLNALLLAVVIGHATAIRESVNRLLGRTSAASVTADAPALSLIARRIDEQRFDSESDRLDYVREWVHDNSIHEIDAEHNEYAFDTSRVLDMLWATSESAADPPHLSCGPRALAMSMILDAIGVRNHMVHAFSDDYDNVRSHTFLDVWNGETGTWEAHDPDFDVFYTNAAADQRVAVAALVLTDLAATSPSSRRGRGWEVNRASRLRDRYFEAVLLPTSGNPGQSVILVNTTRFDLSKQFPGNEGVTFGDFARLHYASPPILELQSFGP